jgi:hypothetical protein
MQTRLPDSTKPFNGCLCHRVAIIYEAEAEEKTSETVIQKIFDELPVP